MDHLDALCTIKEACLSEKAGRTTIYKRIKLGIYEAYKIGGSTRLTVASIKAYRQRLGSLKPDLAPDKAGALNPTIGAEDGNG